MAHWIDFRSLQVRNWFWWWRCGGEEGDREGPRVWLIRLHRLNTQGQPTNQNDCPPPFPPPNPNYSSEEKYGVRGGAHTGRYCCAAHGPAQRLSPSTGIQIDCGGEGGCSFHLISPKRNVESIGQVVCVPWYGGCGWITYRLTFLELFCATEETTL